MGCVSGRMSRHSWPVALLLLATGACGGVPSIASRASFPTVEGTVALGGPAALTPSADRRGLRMTCTGRSCTTCDVELDIQVYQPIAGSAYASFRTQGPMHGKAELLVVTFHDSLSLPQAGALLTAQLRRRPVRSDSLAIEWMDGRDLVRLVKGRGQPARATIRPDPRRVPVIACPAA